LVKTLLESVEAPGHPGAGRVLQAERVSGGEFIGVSHAEEIPSQSMSATDLDGLELAVPAFQAHLRERLEMTGNTVPWSGDAWFLDLGVLDVCEHHFRLAYALRHPPDGAAAVIRALAPSLTPVLLLPKGMTASTGLMDILLDRPLPDRHRVVQDIIASGGLTEQAPALLLAPKNARLVVDTRHGKVWFDGFEIADLTPGTHPFRFVEIMARNSPGTVNTHDLTAQLSSGRTDGDQTARSAKASAKKIIEAALKAHGRSFEDPFKPEKGCFRLTVPAHVS
jgi:hypothetical protein